MNVKDIKLGNDELRVILETGYILREAAKFDEAEAVFRGAMELMPDSEVPHVGLGTVFLQRGNFVRAAEICEAAMHNHPASLYARVHYAEALLFNRQRDEAESQLREIIAADGNSPHAQTAQALLDAAHLIAPFADN